MRLIWNDSVSVGDCISTFPGTLELALKRKAEDGSVGVYWTRESVAGLFPYEKYGIERLTEVPSNAERISIHDAVHGGWKGHALVCHPTAQFLAHVGFEGRGATAPEIVYHETADRYDLLIAPYVCADLGRFWPLEQWQAVIDATRRDHPNISIGVLASTELPKPEDLQKIDPRSQERFRQNHAYQRFDIRDVTYVTDRPLPEVAELMWKAKVVATVDSGPARLMHAVGGYHVLLCHNTVDYNWGTYPECAVPLYKNLASVTSNEVYNYIREGLLRP